MNMSIEIVTMIERTLWASVAFAPLAIGLWRAVCERRANRSRRIRGFAAASLREKGRAGLTAAT
jgi:hypothetical protein